MWLIPVTNVGLPGHCDIALYRGLGLAASRPVVWSASPLLAGGLAVGSGDVAAGLYLGLVVLVAGADGVDGVSLREVMLEASSGSSG